MIRVTTGILRKLSKLSLEQAEIGDYASELLKTRKDQNGENKHPVVREGKKVMCEEKHLWTEVMHFGVNCEAGEILSKIYPEVFEAYEKQNKKANEIQEFILKNFMVDFKQMTFTDHLKLITGMFDYRFDKYKILIFISLAYIIIDFYLSYVS